MIKPWVGRCDNSGPNCFEVTTDTETGDFFLRNNQNPGVAISGSGDEWATFLKKAKAGEFDSL